MGTSLKTGFAQNFLVLPKKSDLPKIWGGCSPPRLPGLYAYVHRGGGPQVGEVTRLGGVTCLSIQSLILM